jgi:membrane protein DedA with SNARE-associated domain
MAELETVILTGTQTIYDAWGWFGVATLLVLENATGITPSEIILGLAGWMLIAERELPPSMIFLGGFYSAIGSAFGASIPYWATRLGGRPLVEKLAGWARIDLAHIARAESQFQRWGGGLVLVGRVIPGIRTFISIPAGLARMPFAIFFVATFIGAYVWCTLMIGAGYLLGHEWGLISSHLKRFLPYLLMAGATILVVYYWLTRRLLAPVAAPAHGEDDQVGGFDKS